MPIESKDYDTAILILIYNKEITDSATISSILKSRNIYDNSVVLIWNNGPNKLEKIDTKSLESIGYDVEVKETINNESLSVIYNSFISFYQANRYIILDDDSVLNEDYIAQSNLTPIDAFSMPLIKVNNEIQSPKINGIPVTSLYDKINEEDEIITIGSGMVIGASIVQILQKKYKSIFDERFYFYGVDTTLCIRMSESRLNNRIRFICGFQHSLSRLESESSDLALFRKIERTYDVVLTLRYYSPLITSIYKLFCWLLASVKNSIRNCRLDEVNNYITILKIFINGKHHRNK